MQNIGAEQHVFTLRYLLDISMFIPASFEEEKAHKLTKSVIFTLLLLTTQRLRFSTQDINDFLRESSYLYFVQQLFRHQKNFCIICCWRDVHRGQVNCKLSHESRAKYLPMHVLQVLYRNDIGLSGFQKAEQQWYVMNKICPNFGQHQQLKSFHSRS